MDLNFGGMSKSSKYAVEIDENGDENEQMNDQHFGLLPSKETNPQSLPLKSNGQVNLVADGG